MNGELTKLKIKAYSDEKFENAIDEGGEFTTLVNPETYGFKYKIEQNEEQASGTSSTPTKFNKILPEVLNLEFMFDRTGVLPDYSTKKKKASKKETEKVEISKDIQTYKDEGKGVVQDIENFKKVILNYNGESHQPNYLKIFWGTLLFKGKLSEMDITFKLFKSDGTPLRAVAKAKFTGFVEDNLRVAQENSNSSDLTHIREIKEGDNLPLLSYWIYGNSKYYLEVAKANRITNFRNLEVGQKIVFPPIEK